MSLIKKITNTNKNLHRLHAYLPTLDSPKTKNDFAEDYSTTEEKKDGLIWNHPYPNLITSQTNINDVHLPVLDIDYPAYLLPSSQLGHYHLYLNKPLKTAQYKILLKTMGQVGLVEAGYAQASISKEYSAVRVPGVQKLDAPKGAEVLKENALLRKENFELKQKIKHLEIAHGIKGAQTNA